MIVRKELVPEKIELKGDDSGAFTALEGYASVFSVQDEDGDVVVKGAFTKTIFERVQKGKVKLLMDHDWRVESVLGTVVDAREDDYGLWFVAALSRSERAQSVMKMVQDGHLSALSIAFTPVKTDYKDGIRYIQEVKLYEISLVVLPANEFAQVTRVKAVVPFQDWPLAPRDYSWDASAAEKRFREYSGSEEAPTPSYKKFFLWYDSEKPDLFGSYKLPIVDIVDGKPKAVPRAVFAAAAAIQGARGGVDIPESDVSGVKNHIARYYEKMRKEFGDENIIPPWEKSVSPDEPVLQGVTPLVPGVHPCFLSEDDKLFELWFLVG